MPYDEENTLEGDLNAARARLLKLAELAASAELSASELNALNVTLCAYLIRALGPSAVKILNQISAEMDSERASDWTIRFRDAKWPKA